MARAPETGFYFEPLTERLALVVEGAPFPSDDQWAHVGDPIEMTQEEARLNCALRWPGVDPDDLDVEFDFDFARAAEEMERARLETEAGISPRPLTLDLDVGQLISQAETLRELAAELSLRETSPAALEAAAEKAAMERMAAEQPQAAAFSPAALPAPAHGNGDAAPASQPPARPEPSDALAAPESEPRR